MSKPLPPEPSGRRPEEAMAPAAPSLQPAHAPGALPPAPAQDVRPPARDMRPRPQDARPSATDARPPAQDVRETAPAFTIASRWITRLAPRLLLVLALPPLAAFLADALLRAAGIPTRLLEVTELPWLPALVLGQLVASWHWFARGSVFGRGIGLFGVAGGVALGSWLLLLFELLQRGALQLSLQWSRGTAWEGLATALVWALLACAVPLLLLAGVLVWRQLAHAVLATRVPADAAHDIAWVLCTGPLAAVALGQFASVRWLAESMGPSWQGASWTAVAQILSVVVDASGADVLVLCLCYVALRLGLGWLLQGNERGPEPASPLVVLDLQGSDTAGITQTRRLHALACTWGAARGPVVLVRLAAHAGLGAGLHTRWAQAARRLPELFVEDPAQARQWCATWLGTAGAPFLRECHVCRPADFREVARAIEATTSSALFVLLPGDGLQGESFEPLRLALPKARTVALVQQLHVAGTDVRMPDLALGDAPSADGVRVPRRLATLGARTAWPWQRERLARELHLLMASTPVQTRLAIVGRRRSERLADALVATLDQRVGADGRRVDAQRPARDAASRFDRVLLLVDAAWLDGEAEALVEVRALQPLVREAGQVSVLLVASDAGADPQRLRAAMAAVGIASPGPTLGGLPEDVSAWADAEVVERVLGHALAGTVAYLSCVRSQDPALASWTAGFAERLARAVSTRLGTAPAASVYYDGVASADASAGSPRVRERVAAADVFVLLALEGHCESEWCRAELQAYIDLRGDAWREGIVLLAASRPAMDQLLTHPRWAPLLGELVARPLFDPQRPGEPWPLQELDDAFGKVADHIAERFHHAHGRSGAAA